jgi:hypothetical protein
MHVNLEKDIKRYEKKNPIRRNSSYDLEIIRCREAYEILDENYVPD